MKLKADANSAEFNGRWTKNRGDGKVAIVDADAIRDSTLSLFENIDVSGLLMDFDGKWSVNFESSDQLAIGIFNVDDQKNASGTFMTTTGDYRYLAGRVDGNLMRLSTFDGAHAFLFHARMQDDGTIEGDFWSGNWWHETWTAVRDEDAALPDAFEQTVIADEAALDEMVFKNLQGVPTRVLDVLDESNAKARIIEIFGTWCPNCSDAARELVSLREQYGDDLAVVGLAFEITEDFERSVSQVKKHHEHIGSDWPVLIAGLSDKAKASEALPVLDKVRSYPTLIFLDRNNEVQAVYSGFSGPATGDAYTTQRERFKALIDEMIK
ncbi:MAG: TlpA family protein disulfide reductase [Phycisphaerales bacterium]